MFYYDGIPKLHYISPINVHTVNEKNVSNLCKVCGEEHAHMSFGTLCCSSCKVFFRRNAQFDFNIQQCTFGEKCDITVNNRHTCRYCRLNKCFSVGMQKELFRASHAAQGGNKMKNKQLSIKGIDSNPRRIVAKMVIYPLDLIRNDRSLLTKDQWALLTNINNCYNRNDPAPNICKIIESQSSYPPKTRLKMATANVMDILSSVYLVIGPFIKAIPEFSEMAVDDRTALMARNIQNLAGISCISIMHETNMLTDVAYSNSLLSVYGSWIFKATVQIGKQLDNDGTLIKLLIITLAFSTCSDVVYPQFHDQNINHPTTTDHRLINTKALFRIQNIYIEMMFKYMIFRYGYNEAAIRLSSLIKNFLHQAILTANAADICEHDTMVKTVVDKTERSLILEDQFDDSTI